jgi:hypothetical protein
MSNAKFQIGFDPATRQVGMRFHDDPDHPRFSPPLKPGEGCKRHIETLANALEMTGILPSENLTKESLIKQAEAAFRRAGYPWEDVS